MRQVILSLAMLSAVSVPSLAAVQFNDNAYHVVDYVINDEIRIDEGRPSGTTQVEVTTTGGIAPGEGFGNVTTYGRGRFTLSGGQVGWTVWGQDYSQVVINGGTIGSQILAGGYSTVTVNSGTAKSLVANLAAKVKCTGGTFARTLELGQSTNCEMSGGRFGMHFLLRDQSAIQLYGSSVLVNGHALVPGQSVRDYASPGTFSGHPCLTGLLTGRLDNGDNLSNTFYMFDTSEIVYVPEPAGLSLLLAGGLSLLRRRGFSSLLGS